MLVKNGIGILNDLRIRRVVERGKNLLVKVIFKWQRKILGLYRLFSGYGMELESRVSLCGKLVFKIFCKE